MRRRFTVRLRITLLLVTMLILAGAAMLAVNFALVGTRLGPEVTRATIAAPGADAVVERQIVSDRPGRTIEFIQDTFVDIALRELTTQSLTALALIALVAVFVGWLVAGRFLRPVHAITDTARRLSEENLSERLDAEGPDDELKELADTFDELLDRLETAFGSQRRFTANVSHELRTPITLARAAVDVLEAKPTRSDQDVLEAIHRVRDATSRSEALITSLLALSRAQDGQLTCSPIDLRELVEAELETVSPPADVRLLPTLSESVTQGDPSLLAQLVRNLIENAILHNQSGGWVTLVTTTEDDQPVLRISNTGPVIPANDLDKLCEPFRRVGHDRVHHHGAGLGLSIVRSVAARHGAELDLRPRDGGGLHVAVVFPAVAQHDNAPGIPDQPARWWRRPRARHHILSGAAGE